MSPFVQPQYPLRIRDFFAQFFRRDMRKNSRIRQQAPGRKGKLSDVDGETLKFSTANKILAVFVSYTRAVKSYPRRCTRFEKFDRIDTDEETTIIDNESFQTPDSLQNSTRCRKNMAPYQREASGSSLARETKRRPLVRDLYIATLSYKGNIDDCTVVE